MARIEKQDGDLVVTLDLGEKVEGMHGNIRVPLDRVRDVEILEDPIKAIHGLRPSEAKLYGTYLPGRIAVGAFLSDGLHHPPIYAVVHHNAPQGVRISLEGDTYSALVLSCDDPQSIRSELLG